jgi:hypothetical protein
VKFSKSIAVLMLSSLPFAAGCVATGSGKEPGRPVIERPQSPTNAKFTTIRGSKDPDTSIMCNSQEVIKHNFDTNFSFEWDLSPGENQFVVYAKKPGNIYSKPWYGLVIRDGNTPTLVDIDKVTAVQTGSKYILSAPAGSAKRGARVVARNINANIEYSAQARADGSWEVEVTASANECLAISVVDLAGNSTKDVNGCLCAAGSSYPAIKCN